MLNVLVVSAIFADLEDPFRVAVIVTVAFNELLSTAENCAVADPAGTMTDCGTMIAELLLFSVTVVVEAAALLSVTEQVLEDAPGREVGLHVTVARVEVAAGIVTVPLPPDSATAVPAGDAPTVFATVRVEV